MKKTILFFISFLLFNELSFGQNRLYENPDFTTLASTHSTIAVLPFDATITMRERQRRLTHPDDLKALQKSEGYGIQSAMYSWFLARDQKGKLSVKVQNPSETNILLERNGISYEDLGKYSPSELSMILKVDAVVTGTFETSKPVSDLEAVALETFTNFSLPTNTAILNLFIYNGNDGEVLCNYHRRVNGFLGSTPENLVNRLMRKASRKIAYTE